jgi:hypothetical protein
MYNRIKRDVEKYFNCPEKVVGWWDVAFMWGWLIGFIILILSKCS